MGEFKKQEKGEDKTFEIKKITSEAYESAYNPAI
jgi:hypothetical protein